MFEAAVKLTDWFKSEAVDPKSLEARFQCGEMAALEEVLIQHQAGIYQLGLRLFFSREKAADFFQEVFIRISEKHKHYNPSRPLKPWLYQVAMNLGRDMLRRKQELVVGEENLPEPVQEPQAEKELLNQEQKQQVWDVLNLLNPTYREIIALRFSSGMSLVEIAENLNISLSAAKVRLCRGLREFGQKFQAQGGGADVL
jgi:RNA polymerase sigma factor (sigma-70 family)